MGAFASFVRFLRLRFLVSFIRFVTRVLGSSPKTSPSFTLKIPTRDQHRTLKANVYNSFLDNSEDGGGSSSGGPHPTLINFCGTGFAIPMHGADDAFCHRISTATGYIVLDVEYRLAPEHPFPAAVNDVEDAIKYVLSRPDEYDASQISLSGFSSGGTLALIAASTLFSADTGTIRSVTAFYPATDLAKDPSERKAPVAGGKRVPVFWTKTFRESYIGDMDARDPRISPIFADESRFPESMLLITAELDTSALEAEELAARATAKGKHVTVRRMEKCGHAFDKQGKNEMQVQKRDAAYALVVDMLKNIKKD